MKICECCGNEFDDSIPIGRYASNRFCSIKCARSFSTKMDCPTTKVAFCKCCGKELLVNKRANINNVSCDECKKEKRSLYKASKKKAGRVRCSKKDSTNKRCTCSLCNKPLKGPHRHNSMFCSQACHIQHRWLEFCTRVEENNGFEYGRQNSVRPKRYLEQTRGHRCEICGITEWMGSPVPLILDHINGNPDEWSLDNLRLVCGNCDMQLPTYKSKNKNSKNSKRASIRRIYATLPA